MLSVGHPVGRCDARSSDERRPESVMPIEFTCTFSCWFSDPSFKSRRHELPDSEIKTNVAAGLPLGVPCRGVRTAEGTLQHDCRILFGQKAAPS